MFADPQFLAFLSFTFVFVVTPGSTTAVVARNTLDNGRRAGVYAALGAACANATHATVAGLGGAALVRAWPGALDAIRLAGGGYLAWLGVRSLWQAYLGQAPLVAAFDAPRAAHHRSFREGLIVNLLGPAVLTLYLSVVPTFIRPTWPRWAYVALAACHVSMAFACHCAWVFGLHRLREIFRRTGPRRALSAATGVALLFLAARVMRQSLQR